MTKHGPFTFRVAEEDVAAAGQLFFRRRMSKPPMKYLLIAIFVFAVLLLLVDVLKDGGVNLLSLVFLACTLPLIFIVPHFLAPRIMRRQYRQSAALQDEATFYFDDDAVYFESSRGHSRLPIGELYAWSETERLMVLHQTEAYFNLIPKEALGQEIAALKEAFAAKGLDRF